MGALSILSPEPFMVSNLAAGTCPDFRFLLYVQMALRAAPGAQKMCHKVPVASEMGGRISVQQRA